MKTKENWNSKEEMNLKENEAKKNEGKWTQNKVENKK